MSNKQTSVYIDEDLLEEIKAGSYKPSALINNLLSEFFKNNKNSKRLKE